MPNSGVLDMSIKAKYLPQVDQMHIALTFGEMVQYFRVTRRQWLSLLYRLGNSSEVSETKLAGSTGVATTSVPSPPPEPPVPFIASSPCLVSPSAPAPDAAPILQAIRIQRHHDLVRLVFVLGEQGIFLDVDTTHRTKLIALLENQAVLAGWDAPAALERLHAAQLEQASVRKGRRLH
jgi:hypothetical protein